MTEPETYTLEAPGAVLHYDVRPAEASDHPVLLIIGSPMGAEGFEALAARLTDRTVVTYDPRGAGRSPRTDGALVTEVEEHADDLHETYLKSGYGPAMAKFIAFVSHQGPVTAAYLGQPAPDPAAFGLPAEDDGSRDDALLGLNMPSCVEYQYDFAALKAAPASGRTRIVIGVGEDSGEMVPGRAAVAVAERLGIPPVPFPGGHSGFVSEDLPGMGGKPGEFAATLRSILETAAVHG